MILSSTANGTYKRGELRWVRNLHQIMLIYFWLSEKCVLKPSVYWRFLDDIFMIWEHSKEDFYKFVKILNTHHPSITVKAELSSESMHFLDTVVYKGFKQTDLRRRVHLIPKFILNQQILWNCYTRNHITQTILLRDKLGHKSLDMLEYVITNKM